MVTGQSGRKGNMYIKDWLEPVLPLFLTWLFHKLKFFNFLTSWEPVSCSRSLPHAVTPMTDFVISQVTFTLIYILEAPWESPQLCHTNFGIVQQKRPQLLLPSFSVHKLKYADTNLPQCWFYHNKPTTWQQKKNKFYYTHTMEIVHKNINNMKSVSISCFHYSNIICEAVFTLTPELLKTYTVSSVSLEQWSFSTGTHLLEGMLIPQTVTPTDNVKVQNNNNAALSIKFWLPDTVHCAYGKETRLLS